jgi:hypothetical protein
VTEQSDRRSGPRHQAYLAAEVVIDDGVGSIAVTKDISREGLLLLTRAKLEQGKTVTLKIHRPGDEERPLLLTGTVVRRQALNSDEIGTWRDKVAFLFQEPQPELAEEFSELAEKQAKRRPSGRPSES